MWNPTQEIQWYLFQPPSVTSNLQDLAPHFWNLLLSLKQIEVESSNLARS